MGFDLACGLCRARLAGCGNANIEQQKAQQARDRELRDENRKFKSFEPENSELPGCARMKTSPNCANHRRDRAAPQGQCSNPRRNRRSGQGAKRAPSGSATGSTPGALPTAAAGANPGGLAGINVTVEDPNVLRRR